MILNPLARGFSSTFRDLLQMVKAPIARRYSGGKDIGAACGTLEASRRGGTVFPGPSTLSA